MQDKGFVKVPRGCVFQELLRDPKIFYVYFMLLYLARYKAETINGVYVKEGQVLITKSQLAENVNMKPREVRWVLDRFEQYGCITTENVRNKFTLITILPVFADGKPLTKIGSDKKKNENTKGTCTVQQYNHDSIQTKEKPCEENESKSEGRIASVWNSVTKIPDYTETEYIQTDAFVTDAQEADSDEEMNVEDFLKTLSKAERLALCGEPYEE